MKPKSIANNKGFTLIEVLAVMVIMGVLGSVATQKFDVISDSAGQRALEYSITELNSRENLTWTNVKLADGGWVDDNSVFLKVDTDIGPGYHWSPAAKIDGGILHYSAGKLKLTRIPSTNISSGRWTLQV